MATNGGSGSGRVVYADNKMERRPMKLENPFTIKVGQVFTGFGVGCGVGIGVGRPINLGAIPVLGQVMSAARGATDAFSGVQRHVNNSLKKVGAKNIEAGIGCGVGFGHGFGVGLAVKPSVLHQIHSQFLQVATGVMERLGINSSSTLSASQGIISPPSLQIGKSAVDESSYENRSRAQLANSSSNKRNGTALFSPEGTLAPSPTSATTDTEYTSQTEKVLNNFLKNLKEDGSSSQEQVCIHEPQNSNTRAISLQYVRTKLMWNSETRNNWVGQLNWRITCFKWC
ncbi:uncharacterized protein LOC121750504 isoform X2 [Salvia splendens]|uniref:uncharacterized protein LOC121750504 isoform X2 n=1 Tax=Salvia splendens TaxID=180675 RepID=UPI001C253F1F|nr:uncharacterized protein LOC121750504 isoform X2 [Salvia splendens]